MERRSSATVFFRLFVVTLARRLRATWTWHLWILALENSSLNTSSRPVRPSIIPKVTFCQLRPRVSRSLKNSRQLEADSLSPAWKPNTSLWPVCVTPIATNTGTFSTLPSMRMSKQTPSKIRYLIGTRDKSRFLHLSTASISSLLALLTSVGDILRPISLSEIIERLRVLIPVRNMKLRSWRISSSYRLLRGMTWVLNSPFRSLGTSTWTSPIPFSVKLRP